MWAIMRGRMPLYRSPYYDPADEGHDPDPQSDEARIPLGPPRTPPQSGAVALPLPEPDDPDLDAYGREADSTQ
jgi:hypothetical protein